jgi:hypothetical protein
MGENRPDYDEYELLRRISEELWLFERQRLQDSRSKGDGWELLDKIYRMIMIRGLEEDTK